MQLHTGCVGDGTAATDLVIDIRGDGRTHGPGGDAVRITNERPGASNLEIEGRADCGQRVNAEHQDGVQVLGGTNITFRNFHIGNYDAGLSTCQGAGGAFFYSLESTNIRVEGGTYIACNHALNAGAGSGHVSGAKFRSGRIDGTDPVCTPYASSDRASLARTSPPPASPASAGTASSSAGKTASPKLMHAALKPEEVATLPRCGCGHVRDSGMVGLARASPPSWRSSC